MGLPWVRVDTDLPAHPKILDLLADPSTLRWRAAWSYVCSICWAAGGGTDGRVPYVALPYVHGNRHTGDLLTKYGLYEGRDDGWQIHNFGNRQQIAAVTEARTADRLRAAQRGACTRWHGPGCWSEPDGCSRDLHPD